MITNMFNDCYPNLGQCRLETSISFCKIESLSEDQASLCCTQQSQTHQSRDSRKKGPSREIRETIPSFYSFTFYL